MDAEWIMFVHCCDKRFQIFHRQLRTSLGIEEGRYDPISIPGGVGQLSVIAESIKALLPIRPQKRIAVLAIHEDCAMNTTIEHLAEAVKTVQEHFPMVLGYLIRLDGTIEQTHAAMP